MQKFEELLNEWLKYTEIQVKPSTYACYLRLARTHIYPFFKDVPMDAVDQNMLSSFITKKLENGRLDGGGGLSEKTVRDLMSIITSVCKYAEIVYKIPHPSLLKWRNTHSPKPIKVFSRQEQKILEAYLSDSLTPSTMGILICLYSGLRLGEICALRWDDLDIDQHILHVRRTVQRIYRQDHTRTTEIIIGVPKTRQSIRDIPIASRLWPILATYKTHFGAASCIISEKNRPFMDPRTYQLQYRKYLAECGLPYRK